MYYEALTVRQHLHGPSPPVLTRALALGPCPPIPHSALALEPQGSCRPSVTAHLPHNSSQHLGIRAVLAALFHDSIQARGGVLICLRLTGSGRRSDSETSVSVLQLMCRTPELSKRWLAAPMQEVLKQDPQLSSCQARGGSSYIQVGRALSGEHPVLSLLFTYMETKAQREENTYSKPHSTELAEL